MNDSSEKNVKATQKRATGAVMREDVRENLRRVERSFISSPIPSALLLLYALYCFVAASWLYPCLWFLQDYKALGLTDSTIFWRTAIEFNSNTPLFRVLALGLR
jgi:hypothetical protein